MYTLNENDPFDQPLTYSSLNGAASSLNGAADLSGTMRCVVIDPDHIRVGVGKTSWNRLERFLAPLGADSRSSR